MKREFWKRRECDKEVYFCKEDDSYVVFCLGVIIYLKDNTISTDLLKIARDIVGKKMDFNNLHGFYRIVVYDKASAKYFFWGDNAGSQSFFVDEYRQTFSDSLLALRADRGSEVEPCYSAIAALIEKGEAFTDETIIKGIHFTRVKEYYIYDGEKIATVNKKLLSLSENNGKSLKKIMNALLKAIGDKPIAAVCTGGVDSRVILAGLIHLGRKPKLIITGRSGNPDPIIAQKVAERLELPLTIYNPDDKEEDWLEKGYIFSDGIYDPVLSYRHLRKLRWALANNISYEFDGVGGGVAKNYFLRCPSIKRHGRADVDLVMKELLRGFSNSPLWSGTALKKGYIDLQRKSRIVVAEELESDKFRTMNRIFVRCQRGRTMTIANNLAFGCVRIDPFLDRDVVAGICRYSQWKRSLNKWHRRQLKAFCPQLSDIPTDKGYSLSMSPIGLFQDFMKRGYVMCLNGIKESIKIVKSVLRLKENDKKQDEGYWDQDEIAASQLDSFKIALDNCRRLQVISDNAMISEIPVSAYGTLYMVGRMFED